MAEENKQESTAESYLDALSKSQGSNRNTEGLGAMVAGPFVIGSVDAINGRGGEEVPEFVATRRELERLVAYWWTERLDHDFDYFVYQSSGSSEWRWSQYIDRRLSRLGEILGDEAVGKMIDDATARWRKLYKVDDEDWRVFTQGGEEEQEAWREKKLSAMTQPEAKALAETFGAQDAADNEYHELVAAKHLHTAVFGYPFEACEKGADGKCEHGKQSESK